MKDSFLSCSLLSKTALELQKSDPELLTRYLTNYSVTQGEQVIKRWKELGEYLLTKYNDGYVKDQNGRPRGEGYPSEWLKEVLRSKPEQFKLPTWGEEKKDGRLH